MCQVNGIAKISIPPQLPHFLTDLNETWNQKRYPGFDLTRTIWLMWDDGNGVCVGRAFSVTFCVLSFFVFLLTPTGHTKRPITTVYGSKCVFPRKIWLFGGLDDKKMFGVKTSQNMIFGGVNRHGIWFQTISTCRDDLKPRNSFMTSRFLVNIRDLPLKN